MSGPEHDWWKQLMMGARRPAPLRVQAKMLIVFLGVFSLAVVMLQALR